jgi:hypothetical protein
MIFALINFVIHACVEHKVALTHTFTFTLSHRVYQGVPPGSGDLWLAKEASPLGYIANRPGIIQKQKHLGFPVHAAMRHQRSRRQFAS